MEVTTVTRKSLFEWKDLNDQYKRQQDHLPTAVLTALTEFDRSPRIVRINTQLVPHPPSTSSSSASSAAVVTCDPEVHAPTPAFPNDDLGELPSPAALEDEIEDLEPIKRVQPQVLQQYHPTYKSLTRPMEEAKEQEDFMKLYWDRPYGLDWLQVQCKEVSFKVGEIEPLWCTLALYWLDYRVEKHQLNVNLVNSGRITEVFSFEVASVGIQERFKESLSSGQASSTSSPSSGEPPSPYLEAKNAMFSINPEQRSPGLFLVLQVSKVLQGDPDRILDPYSKGKGNASSLSNKALEASERLGMYKQPVAFGFCQVFTDKGNLVDGVEGKEGMGFPSMSLYKQKTCWSDSQVMLTMAEIMSDATNAKEKFMEGRCLLLLQDVGKVTNISKLSPKPLLIDSTLTSRMKADESPPTATGITQDSSSGCISPPPTAVGSAGGGGGGLTRLVREIRTLPMWNFNSIFSPDVGPGNRPRSVPMHTAFTNVLYVYPLSLDRSQYRNLAVKVELRALRAGQDFASPVENLMSGSNTLPCIYSKQRGPVFTTSSFTQVSYHTRTPQMNDEIKIRLPDVITLNHFLVFSIYHVHVKKQSDLRRSITTSIKQVVGAPTAALDSDKKNSATLIGVGSLPLLATAVSLVSSSDQQAHLGIGSPTGATNGSPGCLLPDALYSLNIRPAGLSGLDGGAVIMDEEGEDALSSELCSPGPSSASVAGNLTPTPTSSSSMGADTPNSMILKVGTIAQSSIHAQDEKLAQFFLSQPRPYAGYHGAAQQLAAIPETSTPTSTSSSFAALRRGSPTKNSPTKEGGSVLSRRPSGSLEAEVRSVDNSMRGLLDASDQAIAAHFLSVMRQVLRTLCGGTGQNNIQWADPLGLPTLRVCSFITLLHVFKKMINGWQPITANEGQQQDLNILRAYADLVFDEDHAGGIKAHVRPTATASANSSKKGAKAAGGGGAASSEVSPSKSLRVKATPSELSASIRSPTSFTQAGVSTDEEVEGGEGAGIVARARAKWEAWTSETTTPGRGGSTSTPVDPKQPRSSGLGLTIKRPAKTVSSPTATPPTNSTNSSTKPVQVFKLTGSRDRWEAYNKEKDGVAGGGEEGNRWWPWTYEVLIAQWRALVRVFQEAEVEFSRPQSTSNGKGEKTTSASGEVPEYPYSKEEIPSETRKAAQVHGGALFGIIRKSLALRVHHEGLDTPVLLDDDVMWCLEDLVCALAAEISERYTSGLWVSVDLNKALGRFLRDLFQLVHPSQAAILVKSYFKSLRQCVKTEQMELKFEFLDILLQYDYVQINRPWLFNHPKEEAIDEKGQRVGPVEGPEPHWLARLTIEECMQSISHSEASVRVRGISLLRNVLVQHCFDPSYQEPALREGIAAMYLPLIGQLVQRADVLRKHSTSNTDRRELLACLLYVLQNSPSRLVRSLWRHIINAQETLSDETANRMVQQSAQAIICGGQHGLDQLLRVLGLMELAIDTFEYPFGGSSKDDISSPLHVLVPGIRPLGGGHSPRGHGSEFATLEAGGGGGGRHSVTLGTLDRRRIDAATIAISNSTNAISSTTSSSAPSSLSSTNAAGAAASSSSSTGPTGADALQALNSLLQDTRGRRVGHHPHGSHASRLQNKGTEHAGVRAWKAQYQKHGDSMIKTSTVARIGEAHSMVLIKSCKWMCHQSAQVILQTAMSIADEVVQLDRSSHRTAGKGGGGLSSFHSSATGPAGGNPGVLSPAVRLLSPPIYKLLLHVLTTGQSDLTLITTLQDTYKLMTEIGIESFLEAVGAQKSDWIKQTIIYCNHSRPALRIAARGFLVSLLHLTFLKTGSITRIRVPLYHIFCDALSWIWATIDKTKTLGGHESAEVVRQKAFLLLSPLRKCFQDAIDGIDAVVPPISHRSFRERVIQVFVAQLLLTEAFVSNLLLDNLSQRMQSQRLKTKDLVAQGEQSGLTDEPVVQELFLRTAELFDPIESPEHKIHWLQKLGQFHGMRGNLAELAATQVKVYETLQYIYEAYEHSPPPPSSASTSTTASAASTSLPKAPSGGQLPPPPPTSSSSSVHPISAPTPRSTTRKFSLRKTDDCSFSMAAIDPTSVLPAYQLWRPKEEVKAQMLEAASIAASQFASVAFPLLALRSYEKMLAIHRQQEVMMMDFQAMSQVYEEMHDVLAKAAAIRASHEYMGREFSLGGFFRVAIFGPGFPDGKEYVYRLKSKKHLSEFQERLLSTIQRPNGARIKKEWVKVVPDSADEKALAEAEVEKEMVYLKITSIKPMLDETDAQRGGGEFGVDRFYFSVPFTTKGSAQGHTGEQFKRTTVLQVAIPFPCCTSRQVVKCRTVTIQSPIECALDDVKQRCRTMRELLSKPTDKINKNAMMQLLQGSVVPQVHGGALEVAQCFLSTPLPAASSSTSTTTASTTSTSSSAGGGSGGPVITTTTATTQPLVTEKLAACRNALRIQLVDFLHLCFLLILKSREVLGIIRRRASPSNGSEKGTTGLAQADPNRPVDQSTIMWQREVESGFNTMVVKLYPMVNQVEEAGELLKKARELDMPSR